MDRLGTYRGYEISVSLHSNGDRKLAKWHSSIQIGPIGWPLAEPSFTTEPSDRSPSEARERACRIAMSIIDGRPGSAPISVGDLGRD
jgi:hypothetical protein